MDYLFSYEGCNNGNKVPWRIYFNDKEKFSIFVTITDRGIKKVEKIVMYVIKIIKCSFVIFC